MHGVVRCFLALPSPAAKSDVSCEPALTLRPNRPLVQEAGSGCSNTSRITQTPQPTDRQPKPGARHDASDALMDEAGPDPKAARGYDADTIRSDVEAMA